jgi:hypothetical protein
MRFSIGERLSLNVKVMQQSKTLESNGYALLASVPAVAATRPPTVHAMSSP